MKQSPLPMTHFTRRCQLIAWACAGAVLLPAEADPLTGGNFTLTGAVSGGGGRLSGAAYAVEGAVAQVSTDSASGGAYQLTGGLFGVVVVPGEVAVTIERMPDGQARLSWPADPAGFVLQFTSQLGVEPDWQPVVPAPTGNFFLTPTDQPLRLFRLHRQ